MPNILVDIDKHARKEQEALRRACPALKALEHAYYSTYLCFCVSCRSRRKPVPWSSIVKATPVLASDHPLGVIDGSTFTVRDGNEFILDGKTVQSVREPV
ncbi:MAG: hypothetical protein ABJ059_06635 [Hyphomicrobiales bacterium]